MSLIKSLKKHLHRPLFGVIFACLVGLFAVFTPIMSQPAYADTADTAAADETCYDQVGAIGWLVCPATGVLGKAIDGIYNIIEELLTVQPLSTDGSSPIFQVWQIMRDITNIVFVIVLLIIVYSQITGIGIANYGIKKALPKLIIAAVLVNLSFIICALAVDLSNIIGASLRGVFESIEVNAINSGGLGDAAHVTWTELAGALIGGGAVAGISIGVAGGLGAFLWPVLAALIGGILSVIVGLVTIGLRQALVAMLIMIAPLAFVAYLLPNTEQYFKKWKDVLISMLIFYPMFSLLFGAAQLAGWAIIASSGNAGNLGPFFVVLGMAVQVFPLFLSVSLLKMSNTILGSISSKLNSLFDKPRSGVRAFTDQQRQLAANRHINNSLLPSAGLRRYLDARNRRRELDLENEGIIRKGRAEIYARKKIAGNVAYRPGEEHQDLKANASTRSAKEAANTALELSYVNLDTEHVLGHYDTYHKNTKRDQRLNAAAGQNFMQSFRANLAAENDAFADQDWVMGEYNKIRALGESNYKYKSHIIGAAGALGREGEHTVLGEVIAKSAANESKRKSYTSLVYSKYGYGKSDARSMIVGYYVDDDGFATTKPDEKGRREKLKTYVDKNGVSHNISERSPGEFLKYHPEYLEQSAYDKYELIKNPSTGEMERHYYYDARDQQGKFIGRIYKNDSAAMKELLSNWDMPIADPINGLYGILSGIYENPKRPFGLQGVGLAQLSTTLNRATMSSGFKEKAAFAGPMYATSVGQRYITDFVQLNIARLDNLIKTAKPSGFNTQDVAEFNQLQMLMNPANWDWMLFDEQSLRSYRNVNGQHLKGTRFMLDENGNPIRDKNGKIKIADKNIPIEKATLEELKNTILTKFLLPAAPKFATMMSRVTNGIIDNQKPGVAENWNKLLDSMDLWNKKEWTSKYPALDNPFAEQTNDTISRAREISHRIRPQRRNTSINPNQPSPYMRELMYNSTVRANSGMGDPSAENQSTSKDNPKTDSASSSLNQEGAPSKNTSPNLDTTPSTPYQLTEEDRAVDREFMKEEEEAEWSIWAKGPETSRNYRVRIDLLASEYAYDTQAFIEAVSDYLHDVCVEDSRLDSVIEKFEDFIVMNGGDDSLTTEDYAAALNGYIASDTFED
ncbi:MFS transporter [Candidatus Saccharibacteria bacterium]|nr:MFS transporter [Candidatus Saccharibacteria bacterium]